MPLLVFEFIKFICLPVDCDNRAICLIGNSRYLKGKDVVLEFIIGLADRISRCTVEVGLIRELSMEPSHNQDVFLAYLANTATLSCCQKGLIIYLQWLPSVQLEAACIRGVNHQALDCVKILLGLI
jgi:hypothetical protein